MRPCAERYADGFFSQRLSEIKDVAMSTCSCIDQKTRC